MSNDEYVKAEVTFKAKTNMAVLIEFDGEQKWVPRSTLHYSCDMKIDDLKRNEQFEITIQEWLASKIGLEY